MPGTSLPKLDPDNPKYKLSFQRDSRSARRDCQLDEETLMLNIMSVDVEA